MITTKTGKVVSRTSPLLAREVSTSLAQRTAQWLSPEQQMEGVTNLQGQFDFELILRNLQQTWLSNLTEFQSRYSYEFEPQLRQVTATKTATKTATLTQTKLLAKIDTNIRLFPLIIPPAEGEDKKKKKKLWFEKGYLLEAYPGMYPGLMLHFPEPLAPIERLTEPRPIIKKKKISLRRRGTYPVAGFRRVKI